MASKDKGNRGDIDDTWLACGDCGDIDDDLRSLTTVPASPSKTDTPLSSQLRQAFLAVSGGCGTEATQRRFVFDSK
ncbi:hypothetical protein HDU96_005152 [Phlyctochytrium bullatum]|nr:hypothetical protein HDU96_005152 [Phlyctochytrium bullatum]